MLEWDDGGDHHQQSQFDFLQDDETTPYATSSSTAATAHEKMESLFHAALHEGLLPQHVERAGADAEPVQLYYGTLSVAVLTLGLLLLVEAGRRKLDRSALQRPIFQAVLDGVYRELATLGIVELFIHLLHEYYDNLDTAAEEVFVNVHFVLFYTAIFNALFSAILAIFAHRVSYHIWVRTEELELNHYVEIREEFDRVREILYGENYDSLRTTAGTATPRLSMMKSFGENLHRSGREFYDSSGASVGHSIQRFCVGIFYTIKYPRLKAKHDELLVQVRFHEMRVHFLQSYDLPLKLKVSTYLMRSEQQVIKHLIHVSTSAWLWLVGLVSFLYFFVGIITNVTQDKNSADATVSIFFFIQMVVFILISLWMYKSMQRIFMQIMDMKHLWEIHEVPDDDNDDDNDNHPFDDANNNLQDGKDHNHETTPSLSTFDHQVSPTSAQRSGVLDETNSRRFADAEVASSLAAEQLQLFFLSDPKIVVIAIQFMQFGYAIALASIVVFWEDMNSGGLYSAETYLIITLVCYFIYLCVTAQMLPKFTMCTSLGQLVDRKRLHETVAVFRLEEAERRREQRKDVDMDYFYNTNATTAPTASVAPPLKAPLPPQNGHAGNPMNDQMIIPPEAPKMGYPSTTTTPTMMPIMEHDSASERSLDGSGNLSGATSLLGPSHYEIQEEELLGALPVPANLNLPPRKLQQPNMMPAIAEKSATLEPEKASLLVDLVKMDTKALREAMPKREGVPLEEIRKMERADRRRNRRKSVSDGVALMSAVGRVGQTLNFFGANAPPAAAAEPIAKADDVTKNPKAEPVAEPILGRGVPHTPAKFAVDDSALLKRKERRRNRKKAVSASAAVLQMQDFQEGGGVEVNASGGIFDSWNKKTPSPKQSPTADSKTPEIPAATAATPTIFPQVKNMLFGAADDSNLGSRLQQQRQERQKRVKRKKALSASAAVKLMQAGGEYDDNDQALEQQSMMEFWGDRGGPEKTAVIAMDELNPIIENVQAPVQAGLMPLMEVSEHMECSSRHFETTISPNSSATPFDPPQVPTNGVHPTKPSSDDELDEDIEGSDNETVETDRSVGGLSHVGDVTDLNYFRYASFFDDDEQRRTSCSVRLSRLNNRMRHFFLTKSYTFVTHMLGTTLCFFLIGMRVEGFLKEQCIIPEDDHSWDMALHLDFWFVVAWILIFLLESTYKLYLFPPNRKQNLGDQEDEVFGTKREHWIVFIAATIDFFICFTCLMIFFGAEIQRCCDGNEYPVYGDSYKEDDYGYSDEYASEEKPAYGYGYNLTIISESDTDYEAKDNHEPAKEDFYRFLAAAAYPTSAAPACKDTTVYCNCPPFGKRMEGGLGKIEPFVALVCLRLFRFLLARLIVQRLDLGREFDKDGKHEPGKSQRSVAIASTHGDHGTGEFKNGTIVELWQAAISQHSDIVERYGEFSGELLQAMLGVDILEQHSPQSPVEASHETTRMPSSEAGSEKGARPFSHGLRSSSNMMSDASEHVTLDEKKYCKLAPEVQEIIVAGRLGMPVKSCSNLLAREASAKNLASLGKAGGELPLEFEVDVAQMELDKLDCQAIAAFEFPNARLLRSMRRCQRKLLPLLNKWSQVDVFITKHEMVYVHVSDSDGADNHRQLKEAGRQALSATKGGKGLRLIDVVSGRRIVGHLNFNEIQNLHVERKLAKNNSTFRSAKEATAELGHCHVEFWQQSLNDDRTESDVDLQKRFESVTQDSLKIQTIHGTLFLRFLSDLEDSEAHPERAVDELDVDNPLYKDISFQWAQTIVRQCHPGQLKQPLPHFGTNDNDELKDLLQVVHRDEKGHHRRFSSAGIRDLYHAKGHRRKDSRVPRAISELPSLEAMADGENVTNNDANGDDLHPLKKSTLRKSVSTGATPKVPRPRKFTRFASLNENDDGYSSAASEGKGGHRAKSIG